MPESHIMRILIAGLLVLGLSGCAQQSDMPAALTDKFAPQITVKGPSRYDHPVLGISKEWHLQSLVAKRTGYVTHQLYVSIAYVGGWRFFDTASNDQGQSLAVRQIDPSVGNSCNFEICDAMSIDVSDAFLRARSGTGFEVKLSDDAGDSFVLSISADMVAKQLQIASQQSRAILAKS